MEQKKVSTLDLHPLEVKATTVDVSSYGTHFLLNLRLDDIEANAKNCTTSPDFWLSNVTWAVRACITNASGKDVLNVFLVSEIRSPSYTSEAEATFKLFLNNSDTRYYQKFLPWKKFTFAQQSHGLLGFLGDSLLENYITDRKLRFEIEVTTKPLQISVERDMERTGAKVRAVLKNVSHLQNQSARSSEVVVRGIRWTVTAAVDGSGYFAVYLKANNNDLELDWSTNVTVHFKVVPYNTHNSDIKPIEKTIEKTYRKNLNEYGPQLYNFKAFINSTNGYVINDTSVMLIEFEVEEKDPIWGNEISSAPNEHYSVL